MYTSRFRVVEVCFYIYRYYIEIYIKDIIYIDIMYTRVAPRWTIAAYVCADVCSRMLAYAHVCCRIMPYADVC